MTAFLSGQGQRTVSMFSATRQAVTLTLRSTLRSYNNLYTFWTPQYSSKTSSQLTCTVNPLTHIITCSLLPCTPTNARKVSPTVHILGSNESAAPISDYDKHMENITIHFLNRRYPYTFRMQLSKLDG